MAIKLMPEISISRPASRNNNLPVIGGLAAGSSVGWGLLLIQSLFKNAIDKSVEVEYKVTGPWADPQLELVKKVVIRQERVPNDR